MNRIINRFRDGVTLMEVLAAMFVISIGLLGVLAVFPFGAHQVSKGRNAEHVANMLAAAGQDMKMMGLCMVENWATVLLPQYNIESDGNLVVYQRNDNLPDPVDRKKFNCSRFYIFDPFDTSNADTNYGNWFFKMRKNLIFRDQLQEIMTGQDDLVYTLHDDKRTDFSGQGDRIASSGRYTWFMTFAPPDGKSGTNNRGLINTVDLASNTVNVDLLGCYNRMPGDGIAEREVSIDTAAYTQTLNGAQIPLQGTLEELDLSKTKYIFIVWNNGSPNHRFQYTGLWCKIAYAPKELDRGTTDRKTIVVMNSHLPDSLPTTSKAIIIDGILYHKSIGGVPLF